MIHQKYSLEIEQEILVTLMHFGNHNNVRVQKAMLKLNSDCFYNVDNKIIFRMIRDSFRKQDSFGFVDILTLIPRDQTELHKAMEWLIDNYGSIHTGESSFDHYVSRLIILSELRKQLVIAEKMIKDVLECPSPEDCQVLVSNAMTEISGLTYQESKHGIDSMEIAEEFFDGKKVRATKIPTTCDQLNDALNGGIMPKSLIILAAGPSVGKTGFSIFLLDAIARSQSDTASLFFSLEMEYSQIWERHVGICGGKQFDKLSYDEQMYAITKTCESNMRLFDVSLCRQVADIDFIVNTARLRAMEKQISVIVVDYLGLVTSTEKFERNDLKQTDFTTKLASLAIELNCTVIALSQINRGAANRSIEDRCPWPHDASDSSGGHKSATLWLGIDRPALYQDDPCYKNQFVVKCRKNRFGELFELIFAFNEGTFGEVEAGFFKQPQKQSKNFEQALFSGNSKTFYPE